jgi:hypothetical protein
MRYASNQREYIRPDRTLMIPTDFVVSQRFSNTETQTVIKCDPTGSMAFSER